MATFPVNTIASSAKNPFSWVEQYIKPSMFATPDSVLIGFVNNPIKGSGDIGSDVPLLGMCENISINTGINIVTLKELRTERTIIIPSKSAPGSINISRMLCLGANFARTIGNFTIGGSGDKKWRLNSQSPDMKQLFGLWIIFLTADRSNTISSVFAERCAIQSVSINVQAGQTNLYEGMNITFDKLVDDIPTVTNTSSANTAAAASVVDTPTEVNTVDADGNKVVISTNADGGVTTTTTDKNGVVTTSTGITASSALAAKTASSTAKNTNSYTSINNAIKNINTVKALATAVKAVGVSKTIPTKVSYITSIATLLNKK